MLIVFPSVRPNGKMLLPYLISSDEIKQNMFFEVDNDDILLNDAVESVYAKNKIIKTESSKEFAYDKLLIATGADAKIPEYSGSYGKDSVVGVRYLKDVESIEKRLSTCSSKHIILVGAGLVTLETGWALVKRGFSVSYIVRSSRILSKKFDEESSYMIENYIEKNYPVKFIKGDDAEFIDEKDSGIYVKLTSGGSLEGCAVIVGKGVRPNVDCLQNTNIESEKGMDVDNHL